MSDPVHAADPPPEERPLRDVRSGVASFVRSSAEVEAFLSSLGEASAVDRAWAASPCNPQAYIGELRDVVVLPGSRILLDRQGQARSDELEFAFRRLSLRPKRWDMELAPGPVLRFTQPPLSGTLQPAGIHLTGEHETNYFHWVSELLPRLHLYQRMLPDETETPLLVSSGLHPNHIELLRLVCSPGRPIRQLEREQAHSVTRLLYPSDVGRILDVYDRAPGMDTTFLHVGLLRDMASRIKRAVPPPSPGARRRLFLRRGGSYRRLLNEAELEQFLVAQGFAAVDPGELSVHEQVRLFGEAELIVGPSGAAMTNMLWCRPGTRVVVLHSDHPFKKYPYWDALSRAAGVAVSYVSGPRAHNQQGLFQAHDDYSVPTETVQQALP
ncbi:MAG: glycosyltransferase family 61 protein [Rubrivivax sp.]|nr:MAG: glycosyltransferase family 61 protein [Rubrivivax sp.]